EGVAVPEPERLTWINRKRDEIKKEFKRLKDERIILENMAVPAIRERYSLEPPITPEELETFLTESPLTNHLFSKQGPGLYSLAFPKETLVTFDPKTADEKMESVKNLSYGSILFQDLLTALPTAHGIPNTQARIFRVSSQGSRQEVAYFCRTARSGVIELTTFRQLSATLRDEADLAPFSQRDLSQVESDVARRVRAEIDRERQALLNYENSKLNNLQAECSQILNELVAIEMAKRRLVSLSLVETSPKEPRSVLRQLLQTRVDRIPALAEAAGVDVEVYVLPH